MNASFDCLDERNRQSRFTSGQNALSLFLIDTYREAVLIERLEERIHQ
jgi:hypothetical protein